MLDPDGESEVLKPRTIAAHRAYIEAFTAWERLVENGPMGSDEDHAEVCAAAEARKETCRLAFRDLVDELGYVPSRSDIGLRDNGSP